MVAETGLAHVFIPSREQTLGQNKMLYKHVINERTHVTTLLIAH